MKKYDLVVIGGGPAGYVAAIKAAQLGLETACIDGQIGFDNQPALGGTCLNVGCIPSKALLDSSHHYEFMQKEARMHGITGKVTFNLAKMQERKNSVVKNLTKGIEGLLKKNKVTWYKGLGELVSSKEVSIKSHSGDIDRVTASSIIIATGSLPSEIPKLKINNKQIFDSSGALDFKEVPETLCIIGAGVIGLELGSVWRRLGSRVTVLESQENFLESADKTIASEAQKIFKKQKLNIVLGSTVAATKIENNKVIVEYQKKEDTLSEEFEKVIVAVGRKPRTDNLNLEKMGINLDSKGFIQINNKNETSVENVYAIGDCVGGPMLAHKASEEGIVIAERIAGVSDSHFAPKVPWIIYTWPEIAWVGKTEQEINQAGIPAKSGTFPFRASGRSHARGELEGIVKVIANKKTDRIEGVHICGANASELISEAVTAMEFGASSEDVAKIIHGHPTLSESLHEAAMAVSGKAIHF